MANNPKKESKIGFFTAYKNRPIKSNWENLDVGTLNVSSLKYRDAKKSLRQARKKNTVAAFKDAKEKYEKFHELYKLDTLSYIELAEIKYKLGEYESGIKDLEEALRLKENRPKIFKTDQSFLHSKIAQYYAKVGGWEKVEEHIKDIKKDKDKDGLDEHLQKIQNDENNEIIGKIRKELGSINSASRNQPLKRILSVHENDVENSIAYTVLIFLEIFNGAMIGSIKNELKVNVESVKKVINHLEKEGLVEVEKIYDSKVVFLSKDGEEIAKEIKKKFVEFGIFLEEGDKNTSRRVEYRDEFLSIDSNEEFHVTVGNWLRKQKMDEDNEENSND